MVKKILLLLIVLLYSSNSMAYLYRPCAQCGDVFVQPKVVYAGGSLGFTAFSSPGLNNYQIATPPPNPSDHFDNKGTAFGLNADAFIGTLFIGNKTTWFPDFRLQADAIYIGDAKIKGVQTAKIGFLSKYNYHYQVSLKAITVSAIFDIYDFKGFEPFVGAGLGAAQINTSRFGQKPIDDASPSQITFNKSSNTKFIYHLDAGLHYQYTERVLLQAEYRYLDFGKVKTGKGSTGKKMLTPLTSHISTSSFSIGIAYSF